MGVVGRNSGSKRSETERYVISNCPGMKHNEARRAIDEKEKSAVFALLSVSAKSRRAKWSE